MEEKPAPSIPSPKSNSIINRLLVVDTKKTTPNNEKSIVKSTGDIKNVVWPSIKPKAKTKVNEKPKPAFSRNVFGTRSNTDKPVRQYTNTKGDETPKKSPRMPPGYDVRQFRNPAFRNRGAKTNESQVDRRFARGGLRNNNISTRGRGGNNNTSNRGVRNNNNYHQYNRKIRLNNNNNNIRGRSERGERRGERRGRGRGRGSSMVGNFRNRNLMNQPEDRNIMNQQEEREPKISAPILVDPTSKFI